MEPRIAFAGDRDIAVQVLEHVLASGARPLALLVPAQDRASHCQELEQLCSFLDPAHVLVGQSFRQPAGMALLQQLDLDYLVCVHFPYRIPQQVLAIPRLGVLNLHPAFLPYNRGWHTPSWAILEQTPIGATLHFMDEGVDTGPIVHQREVQVGPEDTANSLYRRLKLLELDVFREAWPALRSGSVQCRPQAPAEGSAHRRQDLFSPAVQRIDVDQDVNAGDLLRRLRALTTNCLDEAAYLEIDGQRYRVQVTITKE